MNPSRNARTRRYQYSTDFDRTCATCGQRLGIHSAEAPHPVDDLINDAKECPGFRPVRRAAKKMPPPRFTGKLTPANLDALARKLAGR
jgi:hypothetical protein